MIENTTMTREQMFATLPKSTHAKFRAFLGLLDEVAPAEGLPGAIKIEQDDYNKGITVTALVFNNGQSAFLSLNYRPAYSWKKTSRASVKFYGVCDYAGANGTPTKKGASKSDTIRWARILARK